MNPTQTAKKMALIPILAAIVSSLTYKYVADSGISAEIYTAALISLGIAAKDFMKYQLKWF